MDATIQGIGKIALDIFDSFEDPYQIYAIYSPPTAALIGTFIAGPFMEFLLLKIKHNVFKQFNDADVHISVRGHPMIHFAFLFAAFQYDFRRVCGERALFSAMIREYIVTIVPLYTALWIIQNIAAYNKIRRKVANIAALIIEGTFLFLLYNWLMNFRKKYNYLDCVDVSRWEKLKYMQEEIRNSLEKKYTTKFTRVIVQEGEKDESST